MLAFFVTRLGKNLFLQKPHGTWQSDFKLTDSKIAKKSNSLVIHNSGNFNSLLENNKGSFRDSKLAQEHICKILDGGFWDVIIIMVTKI